MNESCYQGDDSVLKSLVEIADTAPKYLRPNLEATLQLCLKVRSDTPPSVSTVTRPCLTCAPPAALLRHKPGKHAEAAGPGGHRHAVGDGGRHAEETHGDRGSER